VTVELFKDITPDEKTTDVEKGSLLHIAYAWNKLWRTDFLLEKELYFPEGLVYEDNLVHFKAITQADKISVVPLRLYHYRCRLDSITQKRAEHMIQIIPIYNKIRDYLLASSYYDLPIYRKKFMEIKMDLCYLHYRLMPTSMKRGFAASFRKSLSADEREFCRVAPKDIKSFYEMIDGGLKESLKYHVSSSIDTIIKLPERLLRRWIVRPLKAWLASRMNAGKKTHVAEIIPLPLQESGDSSPRRAA